MHLFRPRNFNLVSKTFRKRFLLISAYSWIRKCDENELERLLKHDFHRTSMQHAFQTHLDRVWRCFGTQKSVEKGSRGSAKQALKPNVISTGPDTGHWRLDRQGVGWVPPPSPFGKGLPLPPLQATPMGEMPLRPAGREKCGRHQGQSASQRPQHGAKAALQGVRPCRLPLKAG